jgi:RNA polymerase sigma factor (sigma-70 family)
MVLAVCRRVLGDAHEAEDAFQATFLILARKATSVVRREKVASWLHGVACRTAREARVRAHRRRAREERVSKSPRIEPPEQELLAELRAILDEELARLPARYRGPVVLCELEGLSRREAAQRLGIPEGTLSSRLARGKDRLRGRLLRRGLALPAVPILATLLGEAKAGMLPVALVDSTIGAAMRVAAGCSAAGVVTASVVSLTEGVLKAMLLGKLKAIVLSIGALAVVVSGAAALAQSVVGQGGKAGDNSDTQYFRAEPKKSVPGQGEESAQGDAGRISAMEKKLDRILDALERIAGSSWSSGSRSMTGAGLDSMRARDGRQARDHAAAKLPPGAAPVGLPETEAAGSGWAALQLPDGRVGRVAIPFSLRSTNDRLEAVEKKLDQAQERFAEIGRRLAEIERWMGEVRGAGLRARGRGGEQMK